jgi:hypothetical protein
MCRPLGGTPVSSWELLPLVGMWKRDRGAKCLDHQFGLFTTLWMLITVSPLGCNNGQNFDLCLCLYFPGHCVLFPLKKFCKDVSIKVKWDAKVCERHLKLSTWWTRPELNKNFDKSDKAAGKRAHSKQFHDFSNTFK